jgi:protein-disulfide isomerase
MTTRRKKRRRPGKQQPGTSSAQILIVVGAAVLTVALLVALNSTRFRSAATVVNLAYETGLTPEGEPYKGSPDAPLQVVEYSDFLCPHCGDFADTLDALGPDYIQAGKVQVIFRNYAFLAPESSQAAQAAA